MEFVIEKNVPLTPKKGKGYDKTESMRKVLLLMEVNDSVVFPKELLPRYRFIIQPEYHPYRFVMCSIVEDNTFRVWRIE
jgi:hypothetical protein